MNISFFRLCLATTVLFACARTLADVKCWTGSGSGWSDAASWSPEGVPAADDTVCFGVSATVTPSASFVGTLVISNGTLRVATADDLAFTLAVKTGTTFEKTGAGTVTVRPCPALEAGFATGGAIDVLTGSVVFSGNGRNEAPGYFGVLTVASGASVSVANAPVADRHGVVTRMPDCSHTAAIDPWAGYFADRSVLAEKWADAASGNSRFYDPITEGDGAYNGEKVVPSGFTPVNNYWIVYATRGVLLTPGGRAWIVGSGVQSNGIVWNGGALNQFGNVHSHIAVPKTTIGWTAYDDFINATTGKPTRYFYADVRSESDSGLIGVNEMWNGVCFTGLSVASGATLTIPAGQSLAVADGGALALAGTFTGGADTVFAIMGGEATPDWTAFANFTGTLEIGGYATVHAGTDFAARPFTLSSRGVIVAEPGTAGLTAANCTGTVTVPAGASVAADAALLAAAKIRGAGTVTTTDDVSAEQIDVSDETTLQLGGGANVTFPNSQLASGRTVEAIPAVDKSSTSWQLKTYVYPGNGWTTEGCEIRDDGSARIVNQPFQVNALCFDKALTRDDKIDLSFDMATTRPSDPYPLGGHAEGWGVKLNSSMTAGGTGSGTQRDAFGFDLYMWQSYKFRWIVEGMYLYPEDVINLMNAPYSFDRETSVSCRVGLTNGVLYVTLSQTGRPSYSASRALPGLFRNNARKYLCITGGTGSGVYGDTSKSANYIVADVSNVRGSYETQYAAEFADTPDPKSLVTASDWNYVQNMCCTNENEINLYAVPNGGLRGVAVNTNRFNAFQPFKIAYDYFVDWTRASGYTAEGPAIFFEDKTDNPSGGQISSLSGAGMIPKIDNCFGLWRHYYDNRSKLWEASASSSGSAVESAYWGTSRGETGERVHVELVFDGERHLETTEARTWNSKVTTYAMSHDFDQFATYENGFYVGFSKAGGSGDAYVLARIKNFGLYRSAANAERTVETSFSVAAHATAAVSTSTLVDDPTGGVTIADVSLAEESTLELDPTRATGWLGLKRVRASTGATIAADDGLSVALSTVTLSGDTPNALTVTGAWRTFDGTLTIVVPDTWRDGFLALTLDPTRCGDGHLPTLVVKKASGARAVYQPEWRADGVYLARRGMAVLFR